MDNSPETSALRTKFDDIVEKARKYSDHNAKIEKAKCLAREKSDACRKPGRDKMEKLREEMAQLQDEDSAFMAKLDEELAHLQEQAEIGLKTLDDAVSVSTVVTLPVTLTWLSFRHGSIRMLGADHHSLPTFSLHHGERASLPFLPSPSRVCATTIELQRRTRPADPSPFHPNSVRQTGLLCVGSPPYSPNIPFPIIVSRSPLLTPWISQHIAVVTDKAPG